MPEVWRSRWGAAMDDCIGTQSQNSSCIPICLSIYLFYKHFLAPWVREPPRWPASIVTFLYPKCKSSVKWWIFFKIYIDIICIIDLYIMFLFICSGFFAVLYKTPEETSNWWNMLSWSYCTYTVAAWIFYVFVHYNNILMILWIYCVT